MPKTQNRARIAVYPGTFDPITNGHVDLATRAAPLFERLVVAIADSSSKGPALSLDERIALARTALAGLPNVEVRGFASLLAEFVTETGAGVILRGLRAVSDFEYEFQLALMNRQLAPEIETFFIVTEARYSYLSSRAVKEVFHFGGAIHDMVPPGVFRRLRERFPPLPGLRQA